MFSLVFCTTWCILFLLSLLLLLPHLHHQSEISATYSVAHQSPIITIDNIVYSPFIRDIYQSVLTFIIFVFDNQLYLKEVKNGLSLNVLIIKLI